MKCAGIDYSMSCPSITIGNSDDFSFENSKVYYLTGEKRYKGSFGPNITGTLFIKPDSQIERFVKISEWAIDIVKDCDKILIEGYSMGSKGAVFHIAENTAMLKYQMHIRKLLWRDIAPTSLKKYATGKGNSDKNEMYDSFCKETDVDLRKLYKSKGKKIGSPISDIVDSFYLCKYALQHFPE